MASKYPNNDSTTASYALASGTKHMSPAEALGLLPSSYLNPNPVTQRVSFAIPMEYPSHSSHSPIKPGESTSVFGTNLQAGFISILYAVGKAPLDIWDKQIRSGSVKRVTDSDIHSLAIEMLNPINAMTTFITTPIQSTWTLGIRLPIIVLVLKNLKRYFTFDVQILDDTKTRRRFRATYSRTAPTTESSNAVLTLKLEDGWNQVSMNLAELTKQIYGTTYMETIRVQVYANVRLRRIYFCEKLFGDEDVPADFKVFVINSTKT